MFDARISKCFADQQDIAETFKHQVRSWIGLVPGRPPLTEMVNYIKFRVTDFHNTSEFYKTKRSETMIDLVVWLG